ncbi:MAG: ABC transporter ATP-binding protein [Dongiaceae bacterium]
MPDPSLILDGVCAGYHGAQVLNRLSLEVPAGKLVTIIGPNGHGKTTLLRCISGLVRPSAGEIRFGETVLTRLRPDRVVAAGVVHIPQGDLLFPGMSVRDNLLMGAYLPGPYAARQRRMAEVYRLLPKLEERQGQTASTLSGGERRMLAIGRGLMAEGRILLIDEPSLGLAPIVIDQIYEAIDGLRRAGQTILLVEENASRVLGLADTVYLLDNGQMVWQGAASELASRPELLATYLGG